MSRLIDLDLDLYWQSRPPGLAVWQHFLPSETGCIQWLKLSQTKKEDFWDKKNFFQTHLYALAYHTEEGWDGWRTFEWVILQYALQGKLYYCTIVGAAWMFFVWKIQYSRNSLPHFQSYIEQLCSYMNMYLSLKKRLFSLLDAEANKNAILF
jgi:hypothetical protein